MKKGIKLCLLMAVLFVFTSASAFGGFGLPKLGGKEKKGSSISKEDVIGQQKELIKKYVGYSLKIIDAQKLMLKAFGFKEEAAALETETKQFGSGNVSSKEIKKVKSKSDETQELIDKQIEEGKALSDEGKKYYAQSLPHYIQGVLLAKEAVPVAKNCVEGAKEVISNGSLMEKLKLKKTFDVVLYLAPKVGPDLKNLITTGSKYITYAKKNDIDVPKDTNKALGEL